MGLKLAISNIAWGKENDSRVYKFLKKQGITGIEIAPTRLFGNTPYEDLDRVINYKNYIKQEFNLDVCSLQSIWYGKTEKIFGNAEERKALIEYTKKAILFAEAIGANNLVFGCPKNRNIESFFDEDVCLSFFEALGSFASRHNTVISMEANPSIYGTNFINNTKDAVELVRKIQSDGFKVNLDFGTIIENQENINNICKNIDIVNHIHISEPYLNKINVRTDHNVLIKALVSKQYDGWVSVEMKKQDTLNDVYEIIGCVKEITERQAYYE